jgi:hypothetical protein
MAQTADGLRSSSSRPSPSLIKVELLLEDMRAVRVTTDHGTKESLASFN